MTADVNETKPARRNVPNVVALLFGANAVTQFAIQAWLAYEFADEVWKLEGPLPWFVPIALDAFAITLMAATFILRNAPMRQRGYAWFWLGIAILAQVGAAEALAHHRDWGDAARLASVFPAVFLAASLHALIIVARRTPEISPVLAAVAEARGSWWSRRKAAKLAARTIKAERKTLADRPLIVSVTPRVTIGAAHRAADLAGRDTRALAARPEPIEIAFSPRTLGKAPDLRELSAPAPAPVPEPVEAPAVAPVPTPVPLVEAPRPPRRERRAATRPTPVRGATGRSADPRRSDVIKRCVDGAEDAKAVAVDLGVNPRTAQLWVKNEREQRSAQARAEGLHSHAGGREIARPGVGPSDAPLPKRI
jgi:hypothetical protein